MMSVSMAGSITVPSATILMKSDSFDKTEGKSPQIIIADPDIKRDESRGVSVGAIITDKDEKIEFPLPSKDGVSKDGTQNTSGPDMEARLRELKLLSLGKQLLDNCKIGDAGTVKQLMLDGAPFIADWVGTTPLHWAVMNKHVEVTELLLKAGICKDAKNKVDRSPLHVAAHMGLSYMVKLLLAYGADVNCKDMLSMTPLHWAAESGDLLTTKILLDYGADTAVANKFGKTAYSIAARKNFFEVTNEIDEIEKLHPEARVARVSQLKQKILGSNRAMKPVAEILEPPTVSVSESADSAIRLLKSHGVAMMEPDKDTVVSSAVLNGHTIRLTDAGMLAFKSLERNLKIDMVNNRCVKESSPESDDSSKNFSSGDTDGAPEPPAKMSRLSNGQVLRTVSAKQLIEMKKDKKIVIKGAPLQDSPLPECTIDLPGGKSSLNDISLPDQCIPEGLAERNAVYLQRLEEKAAECLRQVEVLRNQCMIKEQEHERLRKQIDLFKKCSHLN